MQASAPGSFSPGFEPDQSGTPCLIDRETSVRGAAK
jgi:hypothetical protein